MEFQFKYFVWVILAIEQFFYRWYGSYVYLFGIPVKTVTLKDIDILYLISNSRPRANIGLRNNKKEQEAYFQPGWPVSQTIYIFVGTISYGLTKDLKIKVGPVTAGCIFWIFL